MGDNLNLSDAKARRAAVPGKRYAAQIEPDVYLVYRRFKKGGQWSARLKSDDSNPLTHYEYHFLGDAADGGWGTHTNRLTYAQAVIEAQKQAKRKRSGAPDGPYSVKQCMEDYLKDKARELQGKGMTVEQSDRRLYRVKAVIRAHILPTLGAVQAANLSHTRLKAWRDALADAKARVRSKKGHIQAFRPIDANDPDALRKRQATANRIISVLRAALNHAKTHRLIDNDSEWKDALKPFKSVDEPHIRFLSMEEVSKLVATCGPDFSKLVRGALLTGCRYGELTALLASEFNQPGHDGTVYVARSKNGKSRYVHLNDAGIQFFADLVSGRKPKETIFLRNGKLASPGSSQSSSGR